MCRNVICFCFVTGFTLVFNVCLLFRYAHILWSMGMLLRASFIYTFSSFYFVLNFCFVFFSFIFAFKSINKMPNSPTVCFSLQTNEKVFDWVFWKNPFVKRILRAFNMCTNGWFLLIWNRYYWIWLKEAFGWLNNRWKCVCTYWNLWQ